jgi:hypothetical protein
MALLAGGSDSEHLSRCHCNAPGAHCFVTESKLTMISVCPLASRLSSLLQIAFARTV